MGSVSGVVYADASEDNPIARIVRAYRIDSGAMLGEADSSYSPYDAGLEGWSQSSLVLRGIGANGSSSFVDESVSGVTIAKLNTPTISTAVKRFESGSIDLTFGGNGIYGDGSSVFAFGTGDFTIRGQWRLESFSGARSLIDFRPSSTNGAYPTIYVSGSSIYLYANTAERISGSHGMTAGAFSHIELSRVSGVTRLFVEGVQIGSDYSDTNNYGVGALRPILGVGGYFTSDLYLGGYIEGLQIIKGLGLHTANFTPPSAAMKVHGERSENPLGSYSIDCGAYSGEVEVRCSGGDDPLENTLVLRTFPV